MFKRSLITENPDRTDVQIPVKGFVPISFMEWSGWNKEHDEFNALSTWVYTILEPPLPASRLYMPFVAGSIFFGFQIWVVWMTNRTRKMVDDKSWQ